MYKMIEVGKEAYRKCEVEIIDKGRYFWVNRRNLAQIIDKCYPKGQKYRQELTPNAESERCKMFVRNDLVETKIKSCRVASEKNLEFKKRLGLDPDKFACDEQDMISAL